MQTRPFQYPSYLVQITVCVIVFQDRIVLGSDYPFPLGEAHPGQLIESMQQLSSSIKVRSLSAVTVVSVNIGQRSGLSHFNPNPAELIMTLI